MRAQRVTRAWLRPGLIIGGVALVLGSAAAAAVEAETVGSFWRGLWWSVSLMTTVGFIGTPPKTTAGALISILLMVLGFLLLSLLSASLASLFVKEDEEPVQRREVIVDEEILAALAAIMRRLDQLEQSRSQARADPAPGGDT